ncbi:MAG: hypothetical protein ACRYG8_03375 [Janthinobacterium lividum]
MLPNRRCLVGHALARLGHTFIVTWRLAWDTEHDLDLVAVDLDASDESTDDFALAVPVQVFQPAADTVRKHLQAPDDKVQAVDRRGNLTL